MRTNVTSMDVLRRWLRKLLGSDETRVEADRRTSSDRRSGSERREALPDAPLREDRRTGSDRRAGRDRRDES